MGGCSLVFATMAGWFSKDRPGLAILYAATSIILIIGFGLIRYHQGRIEVLRQEIDELQEKIDAIGSQKDSA